MSAAKSFLKDLDHAVSRGTAESRMRALWHTTDLMITGRYSEVCAHDVLRYMVLDPETPSSIYS